MTVPRAETDGTPEESSEAVSGGPTLWAAFVHKVVSQRHSGTVNGQGADPEVDWSAIWAAGDGAPSSDVAIGRVVRAASRAGRPASRPESDGSLPGEPTPTTNGTEPHVGPAASDLPGGVAQDRVTQLAAPPSSEASAPVDELKTLAGPEAAAGVANVAEPIAPTAGAPGITVEPAPSESRPDQVTSRVHVVEPVDSSAVPVVPFHSEVDGEQVMEGAPDEEAPASAPAAGRRSGWFHTFTWLMNIGAIILLFVGWQLFGTSISQHHAQSQLKSEFDAKVQAHHDAGGHSSSLIAAGTRLPGPSEGSVVAEIQVPAIGVDQYVVEGTAEADLSKGPGHYIGTAMPGQAGNVAIAGHRTTNGAPFNGLGRMLPGDRIILTTTSGQHLTYVVSGTPQVVSPRDTAVLNYFGDNRITLTTCNPEFSSSQRLVVVGMLKQPLGGATADAKHVQYHVTDSATASWNWSLLPGLGVVICLLLLLALSYRRLRIWFSGAAAWIILVPLWAAGLYLLFDTLTRFLPTSV